MNVINQIRAVEFSSEIFKSFHQKNVTAFIISVSYEEYFLGEFSLCISNIIENVFVCNLKTFLNLHVGLKSTPTHYLNLSPRFISSKAKILSRLHSKPPLMRFFANITYPIHILRIQTWQVNMLICKYMCVSELCDWWFWELIILHACILNSKFAFYPPHYVLLIRIASLRVASSIKTTLNMEKIFIFHEICNSNSKQHEKHFVCRQKALRIE